MSLKTETKCYLSQKLKVMSYFILEFKPMLLNLATFERGVNLLISGVFILGMKF